MRPSRFLLSAALAGTLAWPATTRAAGYHLYEQSASALGMAGAATASIHDASALFFNPAAMTRLDGTQLEIGGTVLSPSTSFAGVAPYPGYGVTEEMDRQNFGLPAVYLTRRSAGRLAFGAGLNAPFGLGVEWKDPDHFTGRYIVTRADLQTLEGVVSAAWAVSPMWSVGLGANALFAKVKLENRTLAAVPGGGGASVDVAKSELESDFQSGYGWNAALSVAPAAAWKLGAVYRSKIIVDVDQARADFTQIPTGDPVFDAAVAASLPPDQDVKTVLRFPAVWSGAVAWMPAAPWTVEADFNWVEWSVFEDLPIRLQQTPSQSRTIREDYEDSFQIRVGAEHRLPNWSYRFGYYFDEAAAPTESVSPLLPDADRNGATLGFGWAPAGAQWAVSVYDLAVFVKRRSTDGVNRDDYNGEYKSFVNAAGFGVDFRW
jgi:long-chain fatty acid transport protein